MNSGYSGYSMSKRAVQAYNQGEKPLSKFNSQDRDGLLEFINENDLELKNNLTVKGLKEFLGIYGGSSWHHTSQHFNETNFYSIAYALTDGEFTEMDQIEEINDIIRDRVHNLDNLLLEIKNRPKAEKPKESAKEWFFATVTYGEWEGSRKNPKLAEYVKNGIILGNWFYMFDGSKKNITGKYVTDVKNLGNRKPRAFNANHVKSLKKKLDI